MKKFKLPYDWKDPVIVIGYDGQIKLMIWTDAKKFTKKQLEELKKLKIKYLEHKLGYKIKKLSATISHSDYEKMLDKQCKGWRNWKK